MSDWEIDKDTLQACVEHMKGFCEGVDRPYVEDLLSDEARTAIERLLKIDDFLNDLGVSQQAALPLEKIIEQVIEYGAATLVAAMITNCTNKKSVWIYGGEESDGFDAHVGPSFPEEFFPESLRDGWGYPKLIDIIKDWDCPKADKITQLKGIITQLELES
jgi:hypothetical protein